MARISGMRADSISYSYSAECTPRRSWLDFKLSALQSTKERSLRISKKNNPWCRMWASANNYQIKRNCQLLKHRDLECHEEAFKSQRIVQLIIAFKTWLCIMSFRFTTRGPRSNVLSRICKLSTICLTTIRCIKSSEAPLSLISLRSLNLSTIGSLDSSEGLWTRMSAMRPKTLTQTTHLKWQISG